MANEKMKVKKVRKEEKHVSKGRRASSREWTRRVIIRTEKEEERKEGELYGARPKRSSMEEGTDLQCTVT